MSNHVKDSGHISRHSPEFDCNSSSPPDYSSYDIRVFQNGHKESNCDRLQFASDSNCPDSTSSDYGVLGFGYGLRFFIGERKSHYENLYREVFNRLAHLKNSINENNVTGALLFNISFPTKSIHYEDAKLHMLKYSKTLATEIEQLESDIDNHNTEVQKFNQSIETTIADSFIISSTATATKSHKYSSNHVHQLVISALDGNIKNIQEGEKVTILRARIDSFLNDEERFKLEIASGSLRWEYSVLADGDEKTLRDIIIILKEKILKNERILKSLIELTLSKTKIVDRINNVSSTGQEISNTIQNGTFKKAKCCPTFWNLVEKYIL